MGSIDFRHEETTRREIARQARWAYESARLRRAAVGVLPLLAIVVVVAWAGRRPLSSLGFGAIAVAVGLVMLWFGRDPQRAVLPGVIAGLVPLSFAMVANRLQCCGPEACGMWCVPACATGGVLAGLLIARVGIVRRAGPTFWLSASGLALLTGAMGCSCVGYSGVVGLGLGFSIGVVPGLVRSALRPFAK